MFVACYIVRLSLRIFLIVLNSSGNTSNFMAIMRIKASLRDSLQLIFDISIKDYDFLNIFYIRMH